jgi:hypothetical protein
MCFDHRDFSELFFRFSPLNPPDDWKSLSLHPVRKKAPPQGAGLKNTKVPVGYVRSPGEIYSMFYLIKESSKRLLTYWGMKSHLNFLTGFTSFKGKFLTLEQSEGEGLEEWKEKNVSRA